MIVSSTLRSAGSCRRAGAAAPRRRSQPDAAALVDAPRVSAGEGVEFIGVGPGRWLALSNQLDRRRRLARAVGDAGSLFEQSGGLVVCHASGPALPDWLAKLVLLDLAAFLRAVASAAAEYGFEWLG